MPDRRNQGENSKGGQKVKTMATSPDFATVTSRNISQEAFQDADSTSIEAMYHLYLDQHKASAAFQRSKPYIIFQRIFDIVGSGLALILLFPFFFVIAILIKLDNKGTILYRHKRIGLQGKEFEFYKFRSMIHGAEDLKLDLLDKNEAAGPIFKIKDDPRITRIGKFLRRTSLDEAPQFLNVFLGQMSLVGPRPHLAHEVVLYKGDEWLRLYVKPGLMCYREVQGRSRISFDEWVELDLKYLRERSAWIDIKILLKGIVAVIKQEGAM